MTADRKMETATIEIVTGKINELVVVTEGIVEVVMVTENLPTNVINVVKQVTKSVGRTLRVRSEQLQYIEGQMVR